MIRDRLKKREKLVQTDIVNCPGCIRISALILVPPLITGDEQPESAGPQDQLARCEICGKVQRRPVVRICVPGLREPMLAMD